MKLVYTVIEKELNHSEAAKEVTRILGMHSVTCTVENDSGSVVASISLRS
jgi:hypothetical protein